MIILYISTCKVLKHEEWPIIYNATYSIIQYHIYYLYIRRDVQYWLFLIVVALEF